MNDPDNFQSDPGRKRLHENLNRDFQHPVPNDQVDSDKEAHGSSSEGQQDQLEAKAPTKKMKGDDHFQSSKQHAHEANKLVEHKQSKDDNCHSTADIEMKTADGSKDNLSQPGDSSSPAEANNTSGTSDNSSENQLQDTPEGETHDAAFRNKLEKDKLSKDDNCQSTADIEMKTADGSKDNLSQPGDSSSPAEANNTSGTSDNSSENQLQDTPVGETHDAAFRKKKKKDKRSKNINNQSTADIQGYCGLRNQGATCYLNSVLQTLFMTQDFRRAVLTLNEKKIKKKGVSYELKNLFKHLKNDNGSATTNGITHALNIRNVCEQQDAAEYYQKILSEIEPETAMIFQGKKKHSTTCIKGKHGSIDEITSFFSLAIAMDPYKNEINVTESFNEQFEVMLKDGEDQLFCTNCNTMRDMEISYSIPELPEVLTLHLQRFYMDYNYMTYRKNNCPVDIPLQLSAQDERGVNHVYDLYAVVNHTGSLSGGHYYTYIKSFENHQWYEFNDSWVHRIQKLVRHQQNHFYSDTACLLFFRKSSKQHAHEANSRQGKDDLNLMKGKTLDESGDNVHDSPSTAVRDERHLPAQMNNSDFNNETQAKISQPMTDHSTADIEMKTARGSKDNLSKPGDSSSPAEANNTSGTSDNSSENRLQDTPEGETHDAAFRNKLEKDKLSKDDICQSTADIEMKTADGSKDNLSKPGDSSSPAEANNTSGTSDNSSENRLQDTPEGETHDAAFRNKLEKDKLSKDDICQSTADIEMKTADGSKDNLSKPGDSSSPAEANNTSGTSDNSSENRLQDTPEGETHDAAFRNKLVEHKLSKGDNCQSTADIEMKTADGSKDNLSQPGDSSSPAEANNTSGTSDNSSENQLQDTPEGETHDAAFRKKLEKDKLSKDDNCQSTADIEMKTADGSKDNLSQPGDSSSQAEANNTSGTSDNSSENRLQDTPVGETHDAAFRNKLEKDKLSKDDICQSTADIEMKTADGSKDNLSKPGDSSSPAEANNTSGTSDNSSENRLQDTPEGETHDAAFRKKLEKDKLSKDDICQSTADIEMKIAYGSKDNLSQPGDSSSPDCVIVMPETEIMYIVPLETANNDSDEAETQQQRLLNETVEEQVSRRKIPPWVFFLTSFFVLILIVFLILGFVLPIF